MAWTVDNAHSSVEFSVRHMMITTVRGQFETFNIVADVNEENIEQSTVEATVDLASLNTREARRDAHLRSADFFDADAHPTLTFRSTKIDALGNDKYNITGDLTVKGASTPVTFLAKSEGQGKDPWGNTHWGFSAETTLNRKDLGLGWNVALETGGWMVGEQVKVSVEIELVKQAAVPETVGAAS